MPAPHLTESPDTTRKEKPFDDDTSVDAKTHRKPCERSIYSLSLPVRDLRVDVVMSFLEIPQGRALAIVLPSVTLMAHTATFVVLESVGSAGTWASSWVAAYDLVAAAASAVGLLGAIQRRRILIATYLLVHTITLSLISAALLINVLPSVFASGLPFSSLLRYDESFERRMCQELDEGFGWDDRWLSDCVSSFSALTMGAMWAGLVMMAAQWLVVLSVWGWLSEKPHSRYDSLDIEKSQYVGMRQGLGIMQEYKI